MTQKEEIKKLQEKIDELKKSVDKLSTTLYKHIKFIDSTYEGLKNPIKLEDIKKNSSLTEIPLIKQSRLSVMPIDSKSWKILNKMSNI